MQALLPRLARRKATHLRPPSSSRLFTMSATNYSNSLPEDDAPPAASKEQLALPEVPHSNNMKLDMSNGDASVKLDHLGPMVVNVDGTLSRISNWENMAEIEKKATLRIIGKRNQTRLEALKAKKREEEEGAGAGAGAGE